MTMPIAGRLVWRLGPAPIFGAGVAVFLPSLWAMSHWSTEAGWWNLFWPQIGRGVAMGLMFSPLSVATLRALPPRGGRCRASGLYNLFRQTGGSLGIAVLATLIDHRGAIHRSYLVGERVAVRARDAGAPRRPHRGPRSARPVSERALEGARKILSHAIDAQASALAFGDCYLMIFVVFLLLAPLVPLLRRPEAWRPTR